MNRAQRMGRVGGLAVFVGAAAPFAGLWAQMMHNADDPLTAQARLDMAIWMAVFGTLWMIAAWLLWRAWWRQAGAKLSGMDGPAWLLAAAAAARRASRSARKSSRSARVASRRRTPRGRRNASAWWRLSR